MKHFNLGLVALAMVMAPNAFALDNADVTSFDENTIVSSQELDQNLAPAATLDQLMNQQDQATADDGMMTPERSGGGGWYRDRNGCGWNRRQCAGIGPIRFCWVRDGRRCERPGRPGYGPVACFARNTHTGVTYRAQAPRGAYTAATLQRRALATCKAYTRTDRYCVAAGCR